MKTLKNLQKKNKTIKIQILSKTVQYENNEITIKWKPSLCTHSGVCVKTLPKVYNPKEKPWVKIENASTQELKNQLKKCPSGALSFIEK